MDADKIRLGLVGILELLGVFTLYVPLLRPRAVLFDWQKDCRRILMPAFIAVIPGTLLVLSFLEVNPQWIMPYVDVIIVVLYVVNTLILMTLIVRTGGPQASFYGPLPPLLLSMAFLIDFHKIKTSTASHTVYLPIFYAVFTIVVWLAAFHFKDRILNQLTWHGHSTDLPKIIETHSGWSAGLAAVSMVLATGGYLILSIGDWD